METERTTFQLSQDRQVLEARLIASFRDRTTDGDYVLPYSEVNALVGGDVQNDTALSSKLTRAIKSASRQLKIVLGRDPNRGGVVVVGLRQYVGYISAKTDKIRRAAKRTCTEAHRIAAHDGVTDGERVQLYARAGLAGAIASFSGHKAIGKVEAVASQSKPEPISLHRTLEAFGKKGG